MINFKIAAAALGLLAAIAPPRSASAQVWLYNASHGGAPVQTDDANSSFPVGGAFQFSGNTWQTQDVTAGFAAWGIAQPGALPLDVIGLYVNTAAISAGGTGYTNGDTLTLTGGAVLTVTNASGGVIQAGGVSVTTPYMHTCAPSNPVAVLATSGAGTSATFNLTLLSPTAYGTRRLSRCYAGHAVTVARSDTGETLDIDFLADGAVDVATLDGFATGGSSILSYTNFNSGPTPRISKWYDQGGNAYHATQTTAASRPTISPGRKLGNARSVMFDAVGQSNSWNPTATFLNIPTLQITGNSNTMAVLAGSVTDNFKNNAFLQLGYQTGSCPVYGFDNGVFNAGFELANGSSAPNLATVQTSDTPQLMVAVNSATSTIFDVGNTTQTLTGTHIGSSSSNAAGGTLGQAANNILTSGLVDEALVIIVPWPVPPATRLALEASIYQTFQAPPQYHAVIVTVGDSHTDSWSQPFQQSWPRQMMALLNVPAIKLVNAGRAGGNLSDLVASGAWNQFVAPDLTATSANVAKVVFLQGGYNDLTVGQSVTQVEASFTSGMSRAHANGAFVVCVVDALRNATPTINANMQAIGAWLRTNTSCDRVLDLEAYSTFNAATGPWPAPWFQSDQIHLTPFAGAALWGAMAAKMMSLLIPQ